MSPCDPRLHGSFKDMWPLDLASESEGIQPCRVQDWGEAHLEERNRSGNSGSALGTAKAGAQLGELEAWEVASGNGT